jgi:hypothetical protein
LTPVPARSIARQLETGDGIMSKKGNYDAVVSANQTYASDFGDKGKLALPPA